jgi:hypothetical protein
MLSERSEVGDQPIALMVLVKAVRLEQSRLKLQSTSWSWLLCARTYPKYDSNCGKALTMARRLEIVRNSYIRKLTDPTHIKVKIASSDKLLIREFLMNIARV